MAQAGGHTSAAGSGTPGPGTGISGPTTRLFGDNVTFTAELELQTQTQANQKTAMPGKLAFDHGKSSFGLELSAMEGKGIDPKTAAHMKGMGMDKMVLIIRPDKKVSYTVYPSLKAYVESPMSEREAAESIADYKMEATILGKEMVNDHECVKSKTVVTDKEGKHYDSIVWNASDLKNFPLKIETTEQDTAVTMVFKNVSFAQPESSQFEPPAGYARYETLVAMMQEVISKRPDAAKGGASSPPSPHHKQ